MCLVEVASRMLVQDDDVGAETFESPVFLGFEHLADQSQGIVFSDADQHDWKIARDAVRPEAFLREVAEWSHQERGPAKGVVHTAALHRSKYQDDATCCVRAWRRAQRFGRHRSVRDTSGPAPGLFNDSTSCRWQTKAAQPRPARAGLSAAS